MSQKFEFYPQGVCSRLFEIVLSNDGSTIEGLQITGGCDGNKKAVIRLVEGRPVEEVVGLLRGIDCKGKGTSCPDQLSRALSQIVASKTAPAEE